MTYARPSSLNEALSLLGAGGWRILAGGTDLYPATSRPDLEGSILDLNGIASLRGISRGDDRIRIGARTTWTDIIAAELPPSFDALKLAAREVGSVQIQNVGTVAGNLCNASPAADGVPALMVLDAEVELASASGTRTLPLAEFILGNRRTARRDDELLSAILVPDAATSGRSRFLKLGARKYLVISIAMVAARISVNGGTVTHAAICVGSCSERACRLGELEAKLQGSDAGAMDRLVTDDLVKPHLSPIDDPRGTVSYRLDAAVETVRRVVAACAPPGTGRVAA